MSSRRAPARWQSPWPFYAGRRIEDHRRTRRTQSARVSRRPPRVRQHLGISVIASGIHSLAVASPWSVPMSDATQTEAGAVVSLWRYPVKSMIGEELATVALSERGLTGDRAWALQDSTDGKIATAKNPRKWPNLFAFHASCHALPAGSNEAAGLRITLPNGTVLTPQTGNINQILSQALGRQVTLVSTDR